MVLLRPLTTHWAAASALSAGTSSMIAESNPLSYRMDRTSSRGRVTDSASPLPKLQLVSTPIASLSNSSYRHNTQTEEYTLDHLDSVKGAGFEVFWVDAYYTRGGFPRGMLFGP